MSQDRNTASFHNGKFQNTIPTKTGTLGDLPGILKRYLTRPETDKWKNLDIPVNFIGAEHFEKSPDLKYSFWWLGHSSVMLEISGKRILIDPVFCDRASFTSLIGPQRTHSSPIKAEEVSHVDLVLISHDHYDHLDCESIKCLKKVTAKFLVPLGVGKILESWGIPSQQIEELQWWDEWEMDGIKITSTSARHFSGRGLFNRDSTLWCSWCIRSEKVNVFSCNDSGPTPDFEAIGKYCGPFDVCFLPIGAYDKAWPDIHMTPEEAVDALLQSRGKVLVPIHWATFNLALHSWKEPVDRLKSYAAAKGINIKLPEVGERFGV